MQREIIRLSKETPPILSVVIEDGNPNCITDAGLAVQLMRTAALGAAYNVKVNLNGIADADFIANTKTETDECLGRVIKAARPQAAKVEQTLE